MFLETRENRKKWWIMSHGPHGYPRDSLGQIVSFVIVVYFMALKSEINLSSRGGLQKRLGVTQQITSSTASPTQAHKGSFPRVHFLSPLLLCQINWLGVRGDTNQVTWILKKKIAYKVSRKEDELVPQNFRLQCQHLICVYNRSRWWA